MPVFRRASYRTGALTLALALVAFGCNEKTTGKIVGVSFSSSLDSIVSGNLGAAQATGDVTVELKDGKRITAVCERKLLAEYRGGQKVVVVADENDKTKWNVTEILKD